MKFLTAWDSGWFLEVVRHGYPAEIPAATGEVAKTAIPFFPLYPVTVRIVAWLLPVSDAAAAILVSLVAGAVALVVVHRLVEQVAGPAIADRTALLLAFFPGSMVLSMAYAEALTLALAAGCLLGLLQRRWWLAGLCAGLATASRITALALVVACLWEAVRAIRARGEWRAMVAPALAPAGLVVFFAYLWVHTGEPLAYLQAQRAWSQGGGVNFATGEYLLRFAGNPLESMIVASAGLCVIFAVIAGVALVRHRGPTVLWVYAFTVVAVSAVSRFDGLRPRDLLMAFPLFLGLATLMDRRRLAVTQALFAVFLVASLIGHNLKAWPQP
ncbi:MAG: glycosyltransferase 87 family protein [Acidimicrobiia bacterium]